MTFRRAREAIRAKVRATETGAPADSAWDDPLLYALGLIVGLVPVIAAVAKGGAWGAEPTIGMVLSIFSIAGLVSHVWRFV